MPTHQSSSSSIYYNQHPAQVDHLGHVTFLHGLGSSGEDWLLQVPELTEYFEVVAPDLPGHGRSSQTKKWPRIRDYAHEVSGLLDMLDVQETNLVGLSMGGLVAQQLALDRPDLIRSLVLVNTFARLPIGSFNNFRFIGRAPFLLRGDMEGLGAWIASDLFPGESLSFVREEAARRLGRNRRSTYIKSIYAVLGFDVRRKLGAIRAPTLVVSGREDTTVQQELKEDLAVRIPDAHLVTIEGSGHATPIDASEKFNRTLSEFLIRVNSNARETSRAELE